MATTPEALHRSSRDWIAAWREVRPYIGVPIPAVALLGALSVVASFLEVLGLLATVEAAIAVSASDPGVLHLPVVGSFDIGIGGLLVVGATLSVISAAMQIGADFLTAQLSTRAAGALRRGTYADYLNASWSVQAKERDGEFLAFMATHVVKTSDAVLHLVTGYVALCNFVALAIGAFAIEPLGAASLVAAALLLGGVMRPFAGIARRYGARQAVANRALAVGVMESVALSQEIRVAHVAEPVKREMDGLVEALEGPMLRTRFLSRCVPRLYQRSVILLVIAGVAAMNALDGARPAALGSVVLVLIRAMQHTQTLNASQQAIAEGRPFVEELAERRRRYLAGAMPAGDVVLESFGRLEFRQVSFTYEGEQTPALLDVSFTVERGETIGVVGPSGSGKSTLAQLLLRLRVPTEGVFLADGNPASAYTEESWFRRVAFVPQDGRLIAASVADNISFYRDLPRSAVVDAAKRAHVHDDIVALPDGYDTLIADRGMRAVSGGQRQRICIARALATDPAVIVLDEPTSALDMRSEQAIRTTLDELQGSVTMFIIAHRLSTIRSCDRVMVLNGGRMEALGPPAELERTNPFFRDAIKLTAAEG